MKFIIYTIKTVVLLNNSKESAQGTNENQHKVQMNYWHSYKWLFQVLTYVYYELILYNEAFIFAFLCCPSNYTQLCCCLKTYNISRNS